MTKWSHPAKRGQKVQTGTLTARLIEVLLAAQKDKLLQCYPPIAPIGIDCVSHKTSSNPGQSNTTALGPLHMRCRLQCNSTLSVMISENWRRMCQFDSERFLVFSTPSSISFCLLHVGQTSVRCVGHIVFSVMSLLWFPIMYLALRCRYGWVNSESAHFVQEDFRNWDSTYKSAVCRVVGAGWWQNLPPAGQPHLAWIRRGFSFGVFWQLRLKMKVKPLEFSNF